MSKTCACSVSYVGVTVSIEFILNQMERDLFLERLPCQIKEPSYELSLCIDVCICVCTAQYRLPSVCAAGILEAGQNKQQAAIYGVCLE